MLKKCAPELVGRSCTGCEACVQVCAVKALSMTPDEDGFFYPSVNETLCTRCGRCAAVCPVASPNRVTRAPLPETALAGTNRNRSILMKSASGGAFAAIVSAVKPDVVYGMAWTEPDVVSCVRTTSDSLDALHASKYIQGHMDGAYQLARQDLRQGKEVLFSGTPCQIAGLLSVLGEQPENLTTVEIICHGVASPGLFREYCALKARQAGSPVRAFAFRRKRPILGDWESYHTVISYENGKQEKSYQDPFTQLFLSRSILRPSCASCGFASPQRVSDFVIGDYWGVSQYDPSLYRKTGVSVMFPMTEKGRALSAGLAESMDLSMVGTQNIVHSNSSLRSPSGAQTNSGAFFAARSRDGLETALCAFAERASLKQRLKPYLRRFIKRLRG